MITFLHCHAVYPSSRRPCRLERKPLAISSLAPSALSSSWAIREGQHGDAHELSTIDGECSGEGSGGWSSGTFESTMRQTHATVLVASCMSNGGSPELAGFVSGISVGHELQVENIAVRQKHRGHGLGSLLLQSLLKRHRIRRKGTGREMTVEGQTTLSSEKEQEKPCCLLEVKEGNAAALRLYQKLGFRVVGRRKNFYPDGSAGLMMELDGDHTDTYNYD